MSKGKILPIEYKELLKIVKATNENNELNKKREKQDRIITDKFLKDKFNINRKNFTQTIKAVGIFYDNKKGLYIIPDNHEQLTQKKEQPPAPKKEQQPKQQPAAQKEEQQQSIQSDHDLKELKELLEVKQQLLDMLEWYNNKNSEKPILDNTEDTPEININIIPEQYKGEIIPKPIKIYKPIFEMFNEVCAENKGIKKQDLISLCFYEFCLKYKKKKDEFPYLNEVLRKYKKK